MPKSISKKRRETVYKKYKGKCAYCGCKIEINKMHVDHITPLYRGWSQIELDEYKITKGTNRLENLNPSCASCNISKSTFTLEKWRMELKSKVERIRRDSSTFRLLERLGLVKEAKKEVIFYFEKQQYVWMDKA